MKHMLLIHQIILLLLLTTTLQARADKIFLCESDISEKNSLFKWAFIKDKLPLYLYPNDAENLYQQLHDEYALQLNPDDAQRIEVMKFIALQKAIIRGDKSAILLISAGFDNDYELISGQESVFTVPCNDSEKPWLIDIAYLVIAYRKIHDVSFENFRNTATQTIQQRNRQYQNWFDNGLPMWPQETWFNGLFLGESDAEKPARYQWVLLRPSLGIGGNASKGLSNNKLEATLGLEIAGFAHYVNDDYSDYWGLSMLTTHGEDIGMGYGLLLRYNNYLLGYSRRNKDLSNGIGDENEYIYIGYDLYQLADDKKNSYKSFKRKIQTTLDQHTP